MSSEIFVYVVTPLIAASIALSGLAIAFYATRKSAKPEPAATDDLFAPRSAAE